MNDDTIDTTIGGIAPHYESDPSGGWALLTRRLQAAGRSQGLSVLRVTIVVDEWGNPQHWLKPTVEHIEPKARADVLLKALAGKE